MIRFPDKATAKARLLATLEMGHLQCQQPGFEGDPDGCRYSGPCAVGAMLEPEDRQILDDYAEPEAMSIQAAIEVENLVEKPDWITIEQLQKLQEHHDGGRVEEIRKFMEAL